MPLSHLSHKRCPSLRCSTILNLIVILGCLSGVLVAQKCPDPCGTCKLLLDGQTICTTCNPNGYYESEWFCKGCPAECESCTDSSSCTSCNSGLKLIDGACKPSSLLVAILISVAVFVVLCIAGYLCRRSWKKSAQAGVQAETMIGDTSN